MMAFISASPEIDEGMLYASPATEEGRLSADLFAYFKVKWPTPFALITLLQWMPAII